MIFPGYLCSPEKIGYISKYLHAGFPAYGSLVGGDLKIGISGSHHCKNADVNCNWICSDIYFHIYVNAPVVLKYDANI